MKSDSDMILATIRQIIRAVDLQSKNLVKKYGLTGPQLLLLKEISSDSRQSVSELARNISLSQATVTSILDRLEKQGFLKRYRHNSDKRKVYLELSEKAELVLNKNPSLLQEVFTERFDELEEWEKLLLISSLKRVASMMSAESIKSPPVLTSGPLNASNIDVQNYLGEGES